MAVIWISLCIAGWYAFSFLQSTRSWEVFPPAYFSLQGDSWSLSLSQLGAVIIGILCTQTYIQCIFSAAEKSIQNDKKSENDRGDHGSNTEKRRNHFYPGKAACHGG